MRSMLASLSMLPGGFRLFLRSPTPMSSSNEMHRAYVSSKYIESISCC